MNFDLDTLYNLLPAVYRSRDAEQGVPLKALLAVIAEQIAVIEEDLAKSYDDHFIETCADWVVPYIGDLIGHRALRGVTPKIASPRAEVANTIAYRRRKGTAVMLEQFARDVTGWNARVVEIYQRLATTQYMNHVRPDNRLADLGGLTTDIRTGKRSKSGVPLWEPLERLDTAFDSLAHTCDVRSIAKGRGRYNIPNVGIFLWRLNSYRLTEVEAKALKPDDRKRFFFSPLGKDMPLFARSEPPDEFTSLATRLNLPEPIGRRTLDEDIKRTPASLSDYYGDDKSLLVRINSASIPADKIAVCNLSDMPNGDDWAHRPPAGKDLGIDPELGRMAFSDDQAQPPRVTFHYGFSADMGGGEYERANTFDSELTHVESVPEPHATIQEAVNAIRLGEVAEKGGSVQISDNGTYAETLEIKLEPEQRLELRAANEQWPTLELGGDLLISGGEGSEVTLNGLLITGGTLRVAETPGNQLRRLRMRHCTLVPGANPSLIVDLPNMTIEIEHCVIGGLRVVEGTSVEISDSIVDATSETAVAFAAPSDAPEKETTLPGGTLRRVVASTVIGNVHTKEIQLASNSIFMASAPPGDNPPPPVRSEKKQTGCVRFCYLPPSSSVPRRYRCQPLSLQEAARMVPQFTSLTYGHPGYGQLSRRCPPEIAAGADDESEMGAFHELSQPQRITNLRVRLDEYLRFGLEAGIIYAT